MSATGSQKLWLPYFISACGILLTLFFLYIVDQDFDIYFAHLDAIKKILPWLILGLGIGISILIGAVIRISQLAQDRARTLRQSNEDLKKEISERINAEEIKQKLEHALSQGQKLQAMGTLAGGIAHDFNNILYAVIGYIELSRTDVDKTSLTYQNLGKVLEAAQRGQELVARILAFSRRQHHQFEALALKKTIEAALSLLQPTIPASVMLHFEPHCDPVIFGNQTQIHQVLVNLINNAVDAMDDEGTITIKMVDVAAGDAYLKQFPEIKNQNYCKIEIIDAGHGMDQATVARIFEPFFTTKEVGKGTGLGLSIVHTIIKEHEGEITVQSRLGHGTTFIILLPEFQPAS